MNSLFSILVGLVQSIPDYLHERAFLLRAKVWKERLDLLSEGYPAEYVEEQGTESLAWADLLDAIGTIARRRK